MANFVLIHGAWHGAWCWEKVERELSAAGHKVVSIDLPSHGEDDTPAHEVTLETYAKAVADVVRSQKEPVVLVGHSMGGIVISAAAEMAAEKIQRLIYVTAFLPRDGESLLALEERNPRPSVPPSLVIEEGSPTATIVPERIVDIFFNDLPHHEAEAARAKLVPQPLAPFTAGALRAGAEVLHRMHDRQCDLDRASARHDLEIQRRQGRNA